MGQTLTHGIYLPDEGERNCYDGLASNWSILDGAVGTIAEHTTALAGKAPAVHTHTKSDVTDLLNSNFIPSANNSYDLGSSSYQWNNVYSKGYYYNGTAWGLDKDNNWLKNQSFIGERLGDEDSTNTHTCLTLYGRYDTVQSSGMIITRTRSNNSQGGLSENGASRLGLDVLENGVRTTNALLTNIKGYNSETGLFTRCELYTTLASSRLGTSSNPWKLINDVNPGALSLPRGYTEEGADKHYINIASVIQTLDGTLYYYTMPDNGWISVRAEQANQVHVTTDNWKFGQSIYSNTVTTLIVSTPFRKGDTVAIKVIATTLEHARFYPMQGNV